MANEFIIDLISLAKKGYWWLREKYSRLFSRGKILVLCKKININDSSSSIQIKEYGADKNEIVSVYNSMAQYNKPSGDINARVISRIHNGMKFYTAFQDDKVIAYLWLHSVSDRFFDEIGVFIKHGLNNLWLRDVFVVPDKRGQRILVPVINAIVREYYPDARNLYSDVMANNKASLKAHLNMRFTIVGSVAYTRLLGRVLYRKVDVQNMEIYGYRCPHKIININKDFLLFTGSNES